MKAIRRFPRKLWRMPRRASLRSILLIPFVLQIFAAVGMTGWLALRNGQQAVNEVTLQLRQEVSARIVQRLEEYLAAPRAINQIVLDAIELEHLNLNETGSLTRYFWRQRHLFASITVSAMYFGSEQGEFIGLGFQDDQTWQIGRAGQITDRRFYSYAVDGMGNPSHLLERGRPYDPRVRPWYQDAVKAAEATWSPIYVDFKDPRLKITLAQPLYAGRGELRGVVGVDFVLSHIREFLQQVKIGKTGQTFIVERSGLLVATSTLQRPFALREGKVERIMATEVQHSLIRETARYLTQRFADLGQIEKMQQLEFRLNGERQFLQVVPFSDGRNLDWLIVVVVPEKDFMGRIQRHTYTTIQLCLLALAIAIAIGLLTSRWIVQPILQLNDASRAIASGDFDRTVYIERADELGSLACSFNQMSAQLKTSHEQLAEYSKSLAQKVEERTQKLQQEVAERTAAEAALQAEQEKSERLLHNILPQAIAQQLKDGKSTIAEQFESVTILFADLVDFTPLATQIAPTTLVSLLNQIFSTFDQIAERHGVEKIKTVGDAYMAVAGLSLPVRDRAAAIADMALEMQVAITQFHRANGEPFRLRIGINTGTVVAGVIGISKFAYDLWGDTVNVASRMESQSEPGKIQVTASTYETLKDQYDFRCRGPIALKGKGDTIAYWLMGRSNRYSANT